MKPKAGNTSGPPTPLTREVLEQYERLGPDPAFYNVYRVDEGTVVKFGDAVRMAEAAAMRLVREKISVPVPQVFDAYLHPDSKHGCIVMEYIPGRRLDEVWNSYNQVEKENIISQLKRYWQELRSIPGTFIGSVDGTYCEDQFFSNDPTSYGPFESEAVFRDALIRAVRARGAHSWSEMVVRFIKELPRHDTVFTHNDLAPRNILVRDAQVVAIIDWELSGFYPRYWEYVKAHFWPDWQSFWITEGVLDKILEPFILELGFLLHARDIIW